MTPRIIALWLTGLLCAGSAFANGLLVPKDGTLPPLAIKHQRVTIDVKDGVANTRMEQVFKNHTDRDLEAVYIFPVPADAAIGDFAMYINGKRMSGELVEKKKARKIYEDIVRRMKDPGLLERLGDNLFKVSVYPVPRKGDQRIELEYTQTLPFDSGMYTLTYPLKTGKKASQTLEDFTVSVNISSRVPLKNIYSPSHKVGVSRKGDHKAIIGFEEDRSLLDKDFVLYYGVSKKDFGLNLLTSATKDKDGYFMMMLSPTVELDEDKVIQKDVTFVFDTSGSMATKKMEQAREALNYCISRLNKKDRFNIVRFSTDVELFRDELVEASEENRKKAVGFVSEFVARGGTDINGALTAALEMKTDPERPYMVVFLTDGKPTVGTSDPEEIIDNLDALNKGENRVFVFGVGETVNTHLLDRIAGDHGGLSQYVRPEEKIEVKVSSFVDKISQPVLAKLELEVKDVELRKVHPKKLPDLFGGQQVTLFGRYSGDGHVAITLHGEVNGKKKKYIYEADFPKDVGGNDFIQRLWGTRRVGYLLDEIRLNGEDKELKDEVIALSKDYGIMTPYTSYLVLENDAAYKQHGITRNNGRPYRSTVAGAKGPRKVGDAPVAHEEAEADYAFSAAIPDLQPRGDAADEGGFRAGQQLSTERQGNRSRAPAASRKVFADGFAPEPVSDPAAASPQGAVPVFLDEENARDLSLNLAKKNKEMPALRRADEKRLQVYFGNESGREAVQLSQTIDRYKYSEYDKEDASTAVFKLVEGRPFHLLNGVWTDSGFKKEMKVKKVKFGSTEYFDLVSAQPDLKPFLALGDRVIVVLKDGSAVEIEP